MLSSSFHIVGGDDTFSLVVFNSPILSRFQHDIRFYDMLWPLYFDSSTEYSKGYTCYLDSLSKGYACISLEYEPRFVEFLEGVLDPVLSLGLEEMPRLLTDFWSHGGIVPLVSFRLEAGI